MVSKKTIVIIGSEQKGTLITGIIDKRHHKLLLCDKNFTAAQQLAQDINCADSSFDAEALECSYNCAWEADIIILAVPDFNEQLSIAETIKEVVNQKILISFADEAFADTDDFSRRLLTLQQLLPYTNMVLLQYNVPAANTILPKSVTSNFIISGYSAETLKTANSIFNNVAALRIAFNPLTKSSGR